MNSFTYDDGVLDSRDYDERDQDNFVSEEEWEEDSQDDDNGLSFDEESMIIPLNFDTEIQELARRADMSRLEDYQPSVEEYYEDSQEKALFMDSEEDVA